MSDINFSVGLDWDFAIRETRRARAAMTQEMQAFASEVQRLSASGASRAEVGSAGQAGIAARREAIAGAGAAAGLRPEQLTARLAEFDRIVGRVFGNVSQTLQQARRLEQQQVGAGGQRVPGTREIADLSRFLTAQRDLQRQETLAGRTPRNVFDRAALNAGYERERGLRFGVAEETEFRARDRRFGGPGAAGLFGAGDSARGIIEGLGINPESDLGLRTLKDVLVRERESREEIVDLNQRIANEGEREQRAQQEALRRLRTALQERASQEAAAATEHDAGSGGRRSLRSVEAEAAVLGERDRALREQAEIEQRRTLGITGDLAATQAAHKAEQAAIHQQVTSRLRANREYITAQAQTVAAQRQLQAAINREAQDVLNQQSGGGTRFQNVQAAISRRQGGSPRLPTEFQTAGQFLQSRLLTTAGFAVSGAIAYQVQAQVRELIREASSLQTEFRVIQGTLNSVGQTGEEAFARVRRGVLDVAKDTATAADTVAEIQRQLAGAFANEDLQPDFARAAVESRAGFQLGRVTGLPEQEITDSLTAIAIAFKEPQGAFERTGDLIVGLENRFGVLSTEIVRFTADLAPLGAELGITQEQLATIGAAAQQASGQSGAALAENFRRIIPGLQERANEISSIFTGVADDSGQQVSQALGEAFGGNQLGTVFELLLANYDRLDAAQQNQLATLVGGRREAGAFLAVLNRGPAVLESLRRGSDQFAGELEGRFGSVSQSVSFSMDELERAIEEFGIALFESGLADGLTDLASAGAAAFEVLGFGLDIFRQMNEALNGIPGQILGIVVALRVAQAAFKFGRTALSEVRGAGTAAAAGTVGGGFAGLSPADMAALGGPAVAAGANPTTGRLARVRGVATGNLGRLMLASGVLASLVELKGTIDGVRAQADEQNQELSARVAEQLNRGVDPQTIIDQVGDLPNNGGGFVNRFQRGLDRVGNAVSGRGLRDSRAAVIDEVQRTTFETYRPLLEQLSADGDAGAQDLLDLAEARGTNNDRVFDALNGFVARERAAGNPAVAAFDDRANARASAVEAEGAAGQRALNMQEAIEAYEGGWGSQQEVLAAFADRLEANQNQIDGAVANNIDDTDLQLERMRTLEERNRFIVDAINSLADLQLQTAQAFGGDAETPAFEFQAAQERLAALQSSGAASQDDLLEAAFAVFDAQREALDDEIAAADSTAEAVAIARRGVVADVNARAVVAEANIDRIAATIAGGSAIDAALRSLPFKLEGGRQEIIDQLVESFNATGVAESELLNRARDALRDKIGGLLRLIAILRQALGEDTNADDFLVNLAGVLQGQLDLIDSFASSVSDTTKTITANITGGPDATAGADPDDLARQIAEAQIAVAQAQANGDPVRLAQLAQQSAAIQIRFATNEAERLQGVAAMIEAGNQARQAQQDVEQSYIELAQASTLDPVAQAEFGLDGAQLATANARGTAERNRALAQQYQAERGLRDAVADVIRSEIDLAMAVAEGKGDTVQAANLALQQARYNLDRLRYEGAGDAELNRAQAQVIQAEAAARDAALQDRRGDIDFALEMGRISTQQAIQQLQALLQIPNLTEQETREILLTIQRMKDELGRDFQFNLPAGLRLPTVYEARRAGELGGGSAYQGTRSNIGSITVNVNTSGPLDEEQVGSIAAAKVAEVVGVPGTNGTVMKRYGG